MTTRRLAHLAVAGWAVVAVAAGAACSNEPERTVANYCSQASTLRTLDEDLASGDPVRIQARADDLRLLQAVAPSDIEPSIVVLVGVTDDFARTAGTAIDRDQVAAEVFRGRSGDVEAIEAAGRAVATYTSEHCDVQLGGTTTVAPNPGTGTTGGTGGTGGATTTSTPSLLVD